MADWAEFEDAGAGEVSHVPKLIDVPVGPVYYAVNTRGVCPICCCSNVMGRRRKKYAM
jgi:hypothetical protein